jgi:hypothetical protein
LEKVDQFGEGGPFDGGLRYFKKKKKKKDMQMREFCGFLWLT